MLNCIVVVLSDIKLLCLKIIFSNVLKLKEFQYPSIVFLSILYVNSCYVIIFADIENCYLYTFVYIDNIYVDTSVYIGNSCVDTSVYIQLFNKFGNLGIELTFDLCICRIIA